MTGVKGAGGPPPKRDGQRRRANDPAAGPAVQAPAGALVEPPTADPAWHEIARNWYESLAVSGQSVFYEASDWQTAYVTAESMSRELAPQPVVGKDGVVTMVSMPPKAASLMAWAKAWAALLATEGDRRRARIELVRESAGGEEAADVSWIDDARARIRGAG